MKSSGFTLRHPLVTTIISLSFFFTLPSVKGDKAKYSCEQFPGFINCGYRIEPETVFAAPPEMPRVMLQLGPSRQERRVERLGKPDRRRSSEIFEKEFERV